MEKRKVTFEEIESVVNPKGFRIDNVRPLTSHPDDWHLWVVLAYHSENGEWAVWLYNAEYKGLYEGCYTTVYESAEAKFNTKH